MVGAQMPRRPLEFGRSRKRCDNGDLVDCLFTIQKHSARPARMRLVPEMRTPSARNRRNLPLMGHLNFATNFAEVPSNGVRKRISNRTALSRARPYGRWPSSQTRPKNERGASRMLKSFAPAAGKASPPGKSGPPEICQSPMRRNVACVRNGFPPIPERPRIETDDRAG